MGQRNDLELRRLGFEPNGQRGGPPSSITHADGDATAADTKTDAAPNPETDTAANASTDSRANPASSTAADRRPGSHGHARTGRTGGRRERSRHAALRR